MKSVLTIAGSDPSGGAGIQQDLRVFAALGVAGLSAITAITVQNSQGVRSVHPVDVDVLGAQIEAVLEDATDLGAVKIGMLGGAAQVRVVAEMLRRFQPPNIVLDPVLASSGGVPLLDEAGKAALISELFPLADLITPNAVEAAVLTGMRSVTTVDDVSEAASHLLKMGPRAVLIKGGHLPEGKSRDYLFHPGDTEPRILQRTQVPDADVHGTGCFLSAGTAAYMALGYPDGDAVHTTKEDLVRAIANPRRSGKGRPYADIFVPIRGEYSDHEKRIVRLHGLYVLTDPDLRSDRSAEQIVTAALDGGARVIQYRNKHLSTPALIEEASRLRFLIDTHRIDGVYSRALFIVNDRVDVALASGAHGVHLGPEDMHPNQARQILGRDKLIGVSVSSVQELRERVAWDTSYVAVGAIFGSATKDDAGDAIGTDRIREIKRFLRNKPIVAIGGINLSNIDAVIAAGADSAAVISAVVCASNMTEATRELVSRFPAGECGEAAN